MLTGDMATTDEQFLFTERYDRDDSTGVITTSSDSYYRLTAKNFSVLSAIEKDPSLLATKYREGDGVEQVDLLKDLKNMANDKTKMSFRGATASEFLQCMLSDVALNASNANTFQESYSNIASSIDNQRLSISGVDEDEEAVNLVKYQNAYNLASKMIQTFTEIYDRLILETGV
jgi:flagellar hook-associated protein 1 FlgK